MKKLSVFLLTLLAFLGLAACNKTEEPKTEVKDPVSEGEVSEEKSEEKSEVVIDDNISYHVVGGYYGDWTNYTDDNKMTPITKEELAALDADVAAKLADKEIEALVKFEGRVFNVNPSCGDKSAVINDEAVSLNEGYAVKVVRAKYDEEDDVIFAEQWNPDPKTSCVANYTPETLYMPKWVETPASGEEKYGTWADNPFVIGGAGEYTVIFVQYAGANAADSPKYGMALIKTKELEQPKTDAELIKEEYDALVAGTVTEATLFEDIKATVEAVASTDNADGGKDVKVVAKVNDLLIALTFHSTDLTGLEAGREVTLSGKIAASADAVSVGDYNVEIVFANAEVTWAVETYTKVTVSGVPADATAVNAYWWGSADSVDWPGRAMTKNDDGTYSLDFPDKATGLIFNWTVGDATTQTVDLTPDKEKACWTLGEAGEDGKYPATNAKCYYDAVTVDAAALVADLSDSLVESVTEVPAEYDIYVWFWGGSATGWFEPVNADGTFNVAAGSNGCTFLMAAKGATPAWDTKLAQTGDYVIASGVATPKA